MARPLLTSIGCLACIASTSRTASAWVETSVTSDSVAIDVDKSGQATVSHELWMKIRGGPFKGTSLEGVDSDAEPLPGAVVEKIGDNARSEHEKPLLLSRGDDDTLYIEVDDSKGLRAGTYAFRVRYRTNLRQNSRISQRGSWVELGWVGPRYPAGLDVAKVTFRIPYTSLAPRLPEVEPGIAELAQGELPAAAILSTLRRGAGVDELELVRPHVAKGEPVLWRVWAAPATFPWLTDPKQQKPVAIAGYTSSPRAPLGKGVPTALAAILAVVVATIVTLKDKEATRAAAQQGCVSRPLIPVGPLLRAVSAGLLISLAVLLAIRFDAPSCGAMALLLGLLCMTYRSAKRPRALRAPGRWLPLRTQEALSENGTASEKSFLDASTRYGKLMLGAWSGSMIALATLAFRGQPYLAMLCLVATVIPWPLLLTGNTAELPNHQFSLAMNRLRQSFRYLQQDRRLRVHTVARFPIGDSVPDEIRLRISASPMPKGLLGLELALGPGAPNQHCDSLLIRVLDDSEPHRRYIRRFRFSRGRSADERVAIYAPSLASLPRIRQLVNELLFEQSVGNPNQESSRPTTSSNLARSSESGSHTSKPSTSSQPGQATRAA
ncbi:MAG TPA: hypothetical protein VKP30_29050 [Polyangiaceae bacterium]|nr:hypothetical protein [Polyangiaceae bacterium]